MNNTYLEGKESLLFTLGAIVGWFSRSSDMSWIATVIIVVILAVCAEKLVKYLIQKNIEASQK